MLIEFNVENFRSIKEKVTLSMVATKDTSLENNLIKTDVLKGDSLLRSAVLYGANASGKTNFILALDFLKGLVTQSHTHQKGIEIRFTPFKLDKKYLSKPTKFDICFIKQGVKYVYGVSFDNKRILDEYLYHYPKNKKAIIFERKKTDNYKFTVNKKDQEFIAKRTLENVLYLSKATQENYGMTSNAFEWFNELGTIKATDPPLSPNFTAKLFKKDKKWKELILKALLVADVGIEDISVDFKNISINEFPKDMPSELKKLILKDKNEIERLK